jgi:hypothetical protein
MRKLLLLTVCICFVFSSAATYCAEKFEVKASTTVSQKAFPNLFRPIKNIFKRLFGLKRNRIIVEYPKPNMKSLSLSQNQTLLAKLSHGFPTVHNGCLRSSQVVNVSTEIDKSGTEMFKKNIQYTQRYIVTAGKIMGEGSDVIWDLSGVKPGTYQITADAAFIDGLFNGISLTIEICVIE